MQVRDEIVQMMKGMLCATGPSAIILYIDCHTTPQVQKLLGRYGNSNMGAQNVLESVNS